MQGLNSCSCYFCQRTQNYGKAKSVLLRAKALLEPERLSAEKDRNANGSVGEAVIHLDIAYLYLRVGFVDSELGNSELAAHSYKEAIQVFNATTTHPVFSGKSKAKGNAGLVEPFNANENRSLHELHRKELEIALKNGISSALHRLGQIYALQGKSDKAMKSLEDTARILNEIHDVRAKLSNWKTAPRFPFASRCFWEEVSAISTSMILSDANERSGRINIDDGSDSFSLQCLSGQSG